MLTHLPFRSWCPHGARGKSKGKPHKGQQQKHVREIPTVSVDYMFTHETQEPGDERGMPILVMRDIHSDDCGTGMIFARVVPREGMP